MSKLLNWLFMCLCICSNQEALSGGLEHLVEDPTVQDGTIAVVNFGYKGCQACDEMAPDYKQMVEEYLTKDKNKYRFVEVDIRQEPSLKRVYGVKEIPGTIVLKRDKGQWKRFTGTTDLVKLRKVIDAAVEGFGFANSAHENSPPKPYTLERLRPARTYTPESLKPSFGSAGQDYSADYQAFKESGITVVPKASVVKSNIGKRHLFPSRSGKTRIDNMNTHIDNSQDYSTNIRWRFDNMNTHIDNMNTHIDNMNTHIDNMNTHIDNMNTHIDNMNTHIDNMSNR